MKSTATLLAWLASAGAFACGDGAGQDAGAEPPPMPTGTPMPDPSLPDRGGPPDLGQACIPPSEENRTFAGASLTEVALEFTDDCASGLCLVNHFQGRVTCPYGQDLSELEAAPDAPERCRLPQLAGASEEEAVGVAVPPQLSGRTAAQAVYCSCRCAGPDASAEYCECPADMECIELIAYGSQYDGSYCIAAGTAYEAGASYGAPCGSGAPDEMALCGERNP